MPPAKRKIGGWHLPGYEYCGPFTNLEKRAKPSNKVDECCKQHDEDYSNANVSTEKADKDLIDCVKNAGGHKPIEYVFSAKEWLDKQTNYASDKIFRANMPATRSGKQKQIAQHRSINAWYKNKKRSKNDSRPEEWEDCDDDECLQGANNQGMDEVDGGGETDGASGGGTTGIVPTIPYGLRPAKYQKLVKMSYVVYIDAGLANTNSNYGWEQTAAAANAPYKLNTRVIWNEGWQIIPWGILSASMARHEWNILNLTARRWKVDEFGVDIDDIQVFYEQVTQSGNVSTVAYTQNTPIHVYVDDEHILPCGDELTIESVEHNDYWSSTNPPDFATGKLKSPKFYFHGMDTRYWTNNSGLPAADRPEKLMSLYNTGAVQDLLPTQKFSRSYKVQNGGWQSARGSNDYASQDNTTTWDQFAQTNMSMREQMCEPPGGRSKPVSATDGGAIAQTAKIPFSGTAPLWAYDSSYADTASPHPRRAAPYILVKTRPIMQMSGVPMRIYHMMSVHYWAKISVENLDSCFFGSQYDPTHYAALLTKTSNETADIALTKACTVGPLDNVIGRNNMPIKPYPLYT